MPTVLVVDDETGVRTMLKATLTAAGFAVWGAMDQAAAVRVATDAWPDVVLLDYSVSARADAWGIWDALAQVGAGRRLRVVLYSADMLEAERRRAYQQGAAADIDKELSGPPLVAAVRDAMRASGESGG
jgi:two-component system KDP operon response regulator KdpE